VLFAALVVALLLWSWIVWQTNMPVWGATTLALAVIVPAAALKWRDDLLRWGPAVALLSVLIAMQGFHTIEHAVQLIQYHVLKWAPFKSSGLISAANSEWIHFTWNWLVVACVAYLVWQGMRSWWAWALLIWAVAHGIEHTYMLVRFYQAVDEIYRLAIGNTGLVQGLPGILGRDGWLAYSGLCGRIPGLTTASRIDVHFWWNTGEIVLLLLASHPFLKQRLGTGDGEFTAKAQRPQRKAEEERELSADYTDFQDSQR
jgi:hypothetical protein